MAKKNQEEEDIQKPKWINPKKANQQEDVQKLKWVNPNKGQPKQQTARQPRRGQWVNPRRVSSRERMDRRLERYGLLNYQTQGLSQEEIAQRYARANVKIAGNSSWFKDNYGVDAPEVLTDRQQLSDYRQQMFSNWDKGQAAPNIYPQVKITIPENARLTPSGGSADRPQNFVTASNGLVIRAPQAPTIKAVTDSPYAATVFSTAQDAKNGQANWTDISADERKNILSNPTFYQTGEITKYPTWMQQQILADPSFQWDQLPAWQRVYFDLSSSPAGMGAVQGALMGLGSGNPFGAPTGAVLGWAAGKSGYDQTKEFWQQDNMTAGAFGLMNWLAEKAEQTAGMGFLIANAAADKNKDVKDVLNKETWQASSNFFEVITPAWIAAINEGKGELGWDDLAKTVPTFYMVGKIGDVILHPEKYKGEEIYLGANSPMQLDKSWVERINEARKEIKAGRPYREVMAEMQTGVIAQMGDMAGQAFADPLNVLPEAQTKVGKVIAETGGNKVAAEAFGSSGSLVEAGRKYRTLVQTGQALTIDPNFKMDQMGRLSRFIAGINEQGQIKAGSLTGTQMGLLDPIKNKTGWLEDMVTQTPYSRAQTGAGMFYENMSAMLQLFETPEDATKYLKAIANGDMETWAQMGTQFAESPEFYTVLPALKEFDAKVLDGIAKTWEMSAPNRDMLKRVADVFGDNPGNVLEDLVSKGTAEQDFARLERAVRESDSPNAKALLADIEAGVITAETLNQMVEVFTGDGALPWHEGQWKALMLDQMGDHFDKWVTQRLMLDQSPEVKSAFFRTSALMKQAQSILLLGGSPGYAITNGLSNMVHRAVSGIFGYMTNRQIDTFMERMGMTPARFEEGVGIGGMVEQAAGSSEVKTSAMDKAMKGKGPLTTAKDALGKISKGMPFSKLSSFFEKVEGRQAFSIAMKDFWSQSWRRGVGFREMSPELVRTMTDMGVDPKRVYAAIEAGMNQGEIEKALMGRQSEVQARGLIHDAAERTGMSASEAAQMLEKIGILDTLDMYLKGQTTKDGVAQAFRRAESVAQDWMDMKMGEDLKAKAEAAKQRVGLEGAASALDVAQKAHDEFTDAWMDHYFRFGEIMNDLVTMEDEAMKNKAIDMAYDTSDKEFRRVFANNAANYKGIFDAWGMSGDARAMRVLDAIGEVDGAMSGAYRSMRENIRAWREKWKIDPENPQRWDEFRAVQAQNDRIFRDGFKAKHDAEVKMGAALGEIYEGLYGAAAGEAARKWYEDVTAFNDEIVKKEQNFRGEMKQAAAAGVPKEMIDAQKQKYYSETKIMLIAELEKINSEGIARLERVIKKGGGESGGQTPTETPPPTGPVGSDQVPVNSEQVSSPVSSETAAANVAADEVNALLAEAEQRKSAEKSASEARKAAVWDVAEEYWGKGGNYSRGILQDGFALINALRNPDYGGIPNLTWLDDPRLTPEFVRQVLDNRKIAKETNAAAAANEAFTTTAKGKERRFDTSQITENTSILRAIALHGGIDLELRLDITGEKKPKGVPGMFTKKGVHIDEMARMLADDGYPIDVNSVDDPGGVRQATELINRARNGDKVYPVGHDFNAEINAAEQAWVDSFNMDNVQEVPFDSALWQSEFDQAVQAADLGRVYEMIGNVPDEQLSVVSDQWGGTLRDYLSRTADEVAVRVTEQATMESVAARAAEAETTITTAEQHAEAVTKRTILMESMAEAFGLDEAQAGAYGEVSDAVADWYARMTGETRDDFYNRYFGDVRREGEQGTVGSDQLLQEAYPRIEVANRKMSDAEVQNYARALVRSGESELRSAVRNESSKADRIALLDAAYQLDPELAKKVAAENRSILFQAEQGKIAGLDVLDYVDKRPVVQQETARVGKKDYRANLVSEWAGAQNYLADVVFEVKNRRGEWVKLNAADVPDALGPVRESLMGSEAARKIEQTPRTSPTSTKLGGESGNIPGTIKKGMVTFEGMKGSITAFEAADFSTVIHETGHIYRKVLADVAERTNSQYILNDLRTIEEWAGVKDGNWNVDAEEKFARGFERYVTEGHAPTPKLRAAFESFKVWMLDIYKAITGSSIEVKMTDDVRRVFDRMLGAENTRIDLNNMLMQMKYDPAKYYVDPSGNIVPRPEFKIEVDAARVAQDVAALDVDGLKARLEAARAKRAAGEIPDGPGIDETYWRTEQPTDQSQRVQALRDWTLERMKEQASAVDQPSALFQSENIPFGMYDEQSQFRAGGEGLDALWRERVSPLLKNMEAAAQEQLSSYQLSGDGGQMTPEGRAMLQKYMQQVKGEMATTKLATMRYAEKQRDFALLNYGKRYGFDRYADFVMPYQLYTTRSGVNWLARIVDKPALYSNYARLRMQQNRYERDIPERLRGKIKIAAPWLPEWAGGNLYIDPMRNLIFPETIMRSFERRQQEKSYQVIEAERVLQEWQAAGQYSDAQIIEAAKTQQGKVWERAWAEAQMRRESETANPIDFFTSFFGPAWYLTTPLNLAGIQVPGISSGKKTDITTLPLGNTSRALDTVTEGTWAEPFGNLIGLIGKAEDKAREKFSLPTRGEYAEYYTKRQVANMVQEGKITAEQAQVAMIEKSGSIWTEAQQRVDMELAMRVPLAGVTYAALHGGPKAAAQAALPSLFGASLLPQGELEYRGLKQEWNDAWKLADAGDTTAVQRFFDNYPEYEAYLAKNKDDGELLKSFLIGQIWDSYMTLGKTNQKQARAELGDEFNQSFLNKETRSYDTLTPEQLTQWTRMLGGMVPNSSNQQSVGSGQGTVSSDQMRLYPEQVTQVTDTYFSQRTEKFPNYYEEQAGYYALPKSERKKYLLEHPNLKAYWSWKDGWYNAYPEYVPIFNGDAFDRVDTSGWMPGLEDAVRQSAYMGGSLPSGARAALMNEWMLAGQPMDDFDTWVKSVVMPGMMYGGQ